MNTIKTFDIEEDLNKTIDGSKKTVAIIAKSKDWEHHREHILRLFRVRFGYRKRIKIITDAIFRVGDTKVMLFDPSDLARRSGRLKGIVFQEAYMHGSAELTHMGARALLSQIRPL